MDYEVFKDKLKEDLSKHNLNLNNKKIAIIFKALKDLDVID